MKDNILCKVESRDFIHSQHCVRYGSQEGLYVVGGVFMATPHSAVPMKFTLNQRTELATSRPKLALEALEDPGHKQRHGKW